MFLFGRERKPATAAVKAAVRPRVSAPGAGAQKRQSFRSPVRLPVTFIVPSDRRPHRRIGIMRDISAGGMYLVTDRQLAQNATIELKFTLPSKFLDTFARDVKVNEVSPFGDRVRKVRKTVRPFDEMELTGTVVRSAALGEKFANGIRFTGIDRRTEEEIQRFNHYWQLSEVRRLKELDD